MKYKELLEKLKTTAARVREIDEIEEMTDELKEEQDNLIIEQTSLKEKIQREKELVETDGFIAEAEANIPVELRVAPVAPVASASPVVMDALPATVKRWGPLNCFKGENADLSAYRFGQYFRAMAGNKHAIEYCSQNGIVMAVHQEGDNTTGGYLVPTEFDNSIIELVTQYGVFRPNAKNIPMTSDSKTQPRKTGGLDAYFVGEGSSGTESTSSWDQVQYVAKKLMVLTKVSNELSEDAIISIADSIATDIARAFAYKEDLCGFTGTGISTHGGIVGVSPALKTLNGVDDGGGVILAAGDLFSEFTLANHTFTIARVPAYARAGSKWYCSPMYYDGTMSALANAAGGNTSQNIVDGVPQNKFLGYPVVLTEVMPTADAASQIACLFGNLEQAAGFGDRRQMTLAVSDSAYVGGASVFTTDELAVRGTERLDINVHDIGTAAAAGPIVGLMSAAS